MVQWKQAQSIEGRSSPAKSVDSRAILLEDAAPAGLQLAHQRVSQRMIAYERGPQLSVCYIDTQRQRLMVGVAGAGAEVRAAYRELRGLVGEVRLRVFVCAPAARHANKHDPVRPLVGGLLLNCPDVSGVGTLGISAIRQGDAGFVTCGHVVEQVGIKVYQPRDSDINDWQVGQSVVVSDYRGTAISDSAFVKTGRGIHTQRAIWKSGLGRYLVTGTNEAVKVGDSVYMQGAASKAKPRAGDICGTNVTVTFAGGGVLTDQLLATYVSQNGDSGAPVFTDAGHGNVLLVGLNVGVAAPQYVRPAPDPGVYPPPKNGYAVISPWASIAAELGVELG
jgi:hypothetical protein